VAHAHTDDGAARRGSVPGHRPRRHPSSPFSASPHLGPPRAALKLFDDDMDGFVTVDELRKLWRKAADESGGKIDVPSDGILKQLIAEADLDGDGKLSFEEFLNVVEQCA
jgi:hypothetical protein